MYAFELPLAAWAGLHMKKEFFLVQVNCTIKGISTKRCSSSDMVLCFMDDWIPGACLVLMFFSQDPVKS